MRKTAAVKAKITHIKKYIDSLQESVDLHCVNVRLQVSEKVWEEYNAAQDQLEYDDDDDDDETQQYEPDREAFTETYYEMRARIDRIISDDRRARDVSSADSRAPGAPHDNSNFLASTIKMPTNEIPKFGGRVTEFIFMTLSTVW